MERHISPAEHAEPTRAELARHIADLRIMLDAYERKRLDPLQRADKRRAQVRMTELSQQWKEME
jgi:IS5 family transposase